VRHFDMRASSRYVEIELLRQKHGVRILSAPRQRSVGGALFPDRHGRVRSRLGGVRQGISTRRSASMSDRVDTTRPSRAFIESDKVEGTAIHDPAGKSLGTIKRLIIEKTSGRVAYVVIALGGADELHAVPWGKLQYDVGLHAYRTDITERQLREAPVFARQDEHDWSDLDRNAELDAYYSTPPHLRVI
jgi:PRC-barrel domain